MALHILVIDDELLLARALVRVLKDHVVSIECDACHAIADVRAAELAGHPFDVVLCDVKMPGMTGLEILAALRLLRDPPKVVLMTGDADALGAIPADGVIAKPFSAPDLRALVAHLCPTPALEPHQRVG